MITLTLPLTERAALALNVALEMGMQYFSESATEAKEDNETEKAVRCVKQYQCLASMKDQLTDLGRQHFIGW